MSSVPLLDVNWCLNAYKYCDMKGGEKKVVNSPSNPFNLPFVRLVFFSKLQTIMHARNIP